jgi:hypothetical protein
MMGIASGEFVVAALRAAGPNLTREKIARSITATMCCRQTRLLRQQMIDPSRSKSSFCSAYARRTSRPPHGDGGGLRWRYLSDLVARRWLGEHRFLLSPNTML